MHLSIFISVINQLDAQNFCFTISFISCLYMFRAHVKEVKIALHSVWYRCDDTRGGVKQFWPPDDEHMCSKYVEAWNKTYCRTKILCINLVNYRDNWYLVGFLFVSYHNNARSNKHQINDIHTLRWRHLLDTQLAPFIYLFFLPKLLEWAK